MAESLGVADLHQCQGGVEDTGATSLVFNWTNQVLADGAVGVRQLPELLLLRVEGGQGGHGVIIESEAEAGM